MNTQNGSVTQLVEASSTFVVGDVRGPLLSVGKLVKKGFAITVNGSGGFIEKDGRRANLKVIRNSVYLPVWVRTVDVDMDPPDTGWG